MLHLMNSRMMPSEGTYQCRKIDANEAKKIFRSHAEFRSSIGYAGTAAILEKLFGRKIPISRETTVLSDGDEIIAATLRYRIEPSSKRLGEAGNRIEEYDFYHVRFIL